MSLYAELKRRNVFRVAAAYIVLGWLLLQVSSIMLQFLGVPPWVGKTIIALLVIGFIPSLAVAWVFEVGPDGVHRDDGTTPVANGQHARRLDILTIIGVVIVAVIALAEQLRVPPEAAPAPSVAAATVEPAAAPVAAPPLPAVPMSTEPAPRGSIAVLPFANMSPDPENEYFADGIAEELLNVLSRVDGLKVASRTSAFSFKGSKAPISEVARTLNVAHVLEGSVRKQGLRVRITAQLIDASTDQHLWSETYDRDLDDIFAVQEEIARSISAALGRALGVDMGAKVEVERPTADLAAYEAFLRARQLFHQRGAALIDARRMLEEVVERDPKFAGAWALLSGVHATMASYGLTDEAGGEALAREAAERARSLDDTLGLPYAVLGNIAYETGHMLQGLDLLDRAIERDPADSTAHLWRGLMHLAAGHFATAETDLRDALAMDPLSPISHGWLGAIRGIRGDRADGDAHLLRAYELGFPSAGFLQAPFSLADGDRTLAARQVASTLDRLPNPDPAAKPVLDAVRAAIGDPAANARFLAAVRTHRVPFLDMSYLLILGMHDEAIALSEEQGPTGNSLHYRMAWMPTARAALSRPGFLRLAERDGLVAFWEAKGYPEGCHIVDAPERHLDCTERAP